MRVSAGEPVVASTLAANTSTGPKTLALPAGSPAIGAVPAAACTVTTDERGFARPGDPKLGGACDAGAYEVQAAGSSVDCPAGASGCGSKTSAPGRGATATSGAVSASSSGRGSLAVGTYRKDPVGALASSAGSYFGLYLSTGNRFGSVVVTSCGTGTSFDWWTGRAWAPVVGEGGHTVASATSCLTVTLGPTSSPSLSTVVRASRSSRFGAVIFGVTTTR